MTSEFWQQLYLAYVEAPVSQLGYTRYRHWLAEEADRLQFYGWKIHTTESQITEEDLLKYWWPSHSLPVWNDDTMLEETHPLVAVSSIKDWSTKQPLSFNSLARAIHDHHHCITGLGFSHAEEVLLAVHVTAKGLLGTDDTVKAVYLSEVAGQAAYNKVTGTFVTPQQPKMIHETLLQDMGLFVYH